MVRIMDFNLTTLTAPLEGQAEGKEPSSLELYDAVTGIASQLNAIEREPIDWKTADHQCQCLLSEHTKDLKTASLLVFAWYQQYSFAGLKAGFELLHALVTSDYREDLFPTRKKNKNKLRAAPFIWLENQLDKEFSINPIEDESKLLNADEAIIAFSTLTNALRDYLEEQCPPFSSLKLIFSRFEATISELRSSQQEQSVDISAQVAEEKPPAAASDVSKAATPPPQRQPEPARAPQTVNVPSGASEKDIPKVLSSVGNALKGVSQILREKNLYDPNAFYISRTAKWVLIQQLPPNNVLPKQPSDETLANISALETEGRYEDVIALAEREFDNGAIFCIALHRYVHSALVNLNHDNAAQVVLDCTKSFINRFELIYASTFSNGELFVDEITKAWLASTDTSEAADENLQDTQSDEQETGNWKATARTAQTLISQGKTKEALSLLENESGKASSLYESTMWKYEVSSVLSMSGYDDIALLILSHIKQTVDSAAVSQWQPDLKINVLKSMLMCYTKQSNKGNVNPERLLEISQLKSELVKLSPFDALTFTESKKLN